MSLRITFNVMESELVTTGEECPWCGWYGGGLVWLVNDVEQGKKHRADMMKIFCPHILD